MSQPTQTLPRIRERFRSIWHRVHKKGKLRQLLAPTLGLDPNPIASNNFYIDVWFTLWTIALAILALAIVSDKAVSVLSE